MRTLSLCKLFFVGAGVSCKNNLSVYISVNNKNNFLDCDWLNELLFSASLLAKLLSDNLLSDRAISQSHQK